MTRISDILKKAHDGDHLPGYTVEQIKVLNRLDVALSDVPAALEQLLALQGSDAHMKEWHQLARDIKVLCTKLQAKLDKMGVETQTDGKSVS